MSIDYDCGIMVGIEYSAACEIWSSADIDQLLDDCVLEYASPYYDASKEDWIIGYWFRSELNEDLFAADVKLLKMKLQTVLGDSVEYKTYCTLNVT